MLNEVWCPTENEVIDAVVSKLETLNFKVVSTCNTKEHGVDIVSQKEQYTLLIEAKGGTSSMKGSNNYGRPFNRNQARTHISVALFTAMNLISEYKDRDKVIVGIALPYEKNHIEFIEKLKYALNKLEVVIFWVSRKEVLIEFTNSNIEKVFKHNILSHNAKEIEECFKHNASIEGFIEYLYSLGTLSEKSVKDDISRMNSMKMRGIDFTNGEEYIKRELEKSNLSESTINSCLRLCRRYSDYCNSKQV